MEFGQGALEHVSWIAVAACGVATLVLGGLWYSPLLFNKIWMREAGVTPDMAKGMNMPLVMGGTLVMMPELSLYR